ncbi:MAG: PAAR-like domain-containing protein [Myxococcota bacterium]
MAKVGINPPKTPVTKGSNGIAAATVPNICKMPGPPAPFVPAPLPNIGKSGDSPKGYSKKVKIEGKTVAIKGATFKSMGDVASKGTGGGLVSANTHGITKFVGPGSLDVKIEGKNVHLLSDPMLNNCGGSGSPPNSATLAGVIQMVSLPAKGSPEKCPTCKKANGTNKSDGKPYDEFFSEDERKEFDQIAADHPDLTEMLPPKDGIFKVRSPRDNSKARGDYRKTRKKAGMTGDGDELHHPHSIKTGGCPVHQPLVQKPQEPDPEAARVQSVDDQINDITNRAITRNS